MSYNRSAKTERGHNEYALELSHYPHPSMWKKRKERGQ